MRTCRVALLAVALLAALALASADEPAGNEKPAAAAEKPAAAAESAKGATVAGEPSGAQGAPGVGAPHAAPAPGGGEAPGNENGGLRGGPRAGRRAGGGPGGHGGRHGGDGGGRRRNRGHNATQLNTAADAPGWGRKGGAKFDQLQKGSKPMGRILVAAIVDVLPPKPVAIPLSEEDLYTFHAARDALLEYAQSKEGEWDVTKPETKTQLREKMKANQKQAADYAVEAVKGGMSLFQAKHGLILAQMDALAKTNPEIVKKHVDKTRERMNRGQHAAGQHTGAELKERRDKNMVKNHAAELAQLKDMDDLKKDHYVRRKFHFQKIPRILEE